MKNIDTINGQKKLKKKNLYHIKWQVFCHME